MIFSALNEDGIPSWLLIAQGEKTVSRRSHPIKVGSIRSVQPARAKKAVCEFHEPKSHQCLECEACPAEGKCDYYAPLRIRILSCEREARWNRIEFPANKKRLNEEARREGFKSWAGLQAALRKCYPKGIPPLWRVEFKVI